MDREDIIKLAREAGLAYGSDEKPLGSVTRFAALVAAAERNKLAAWMMERGYATGHGDSMEGLLQELDWQIAENWTRGMVNGVHAEREARAKVVEILIPEQTEDGLIGHTIAKAIRERGLPPYTTPPVQEFVCSTGLCRLTLTQTNVGIKEPWGYRGATVAHDTEAKLKEKNT